MHDCFTGLIANVHHVPRSASSFDVHLCGAEVVSAGTDSHKFSVGGAGWTRETAEAACLGEAVERWQSVGLKTDSAVVAAYESWPRTEEAVTPDAWTLFHADQYRQSGFPFEPLTAETELSWVLCRRAEDGRAVYVPEEFVFLNPRSGSHRFGPVTSTGLTCGTPGQPVLLRGVQEVLERDALMNAWWGQYPVKRLSGEPVWQLAGDEVARRLRRPNLTFEFFQVESPYARNVTLVVLSGNGENGFTRVLGSACRETLASSLRKSLLEAAQCWQYIQMLRDTLMPDANTAPDRMISMPTTFPEHGAFYTFHPELWNRTVLAQIVDETPPKVDQEPDSLAVLQARLGPNRPILFRNVTPQGLARAGDARYVMRVLIPGTQPMHGDHRLPFLGRIPHSGPALAQWWAEQLPHPLP